MDRATVSPPHGTVWALGCSDSRPSPAQTRVESPMRSRVAPLAAAAGNARGSAVTVTTSAEVVGSSIGRLSHHRMMSGSVCDGLELVRRP